MECDLCGKTASATATVEGAKLTVCAACAKHGENVREIRIQAPVKKKPSQSAAGPGSSATQKEELIEIVRPDFAKLLRQYREKQKLNQEQFAAKLQIRPSVYSHYENGNTTPDTATARKLEHIIGTPLVVHIKVQSAPTHSAEDHQARGLQLGDFFKKKK